MKTVHLGDTLPVLAEKYLGDAELAPAIVIATNQKNMEDPTFAHIANADVILHPGWKLYSRQRKRP